MFVRRKYVVNAFMKLVPGYCSLSFKQPSNNTVTVSVDTRVKQAFHLLSLHHNGMIDSCGLQNDRILLNFDFFI